MPLKLSLPPPGEGLQLKAETRLKQLKAWLEALPLANVTEAARSVSDALSSLNRIALGDDARFKLLELYGPAIDNLVEELQLKYIQVSLPLPEKSRQAAALARTLFTELAYGYKMVLLARLDRRISFGATHLHLVIQRALAALSKVLSVFYKTYSPAPEGVWAEIHQLAELALQRSLHDEPLDGGQHSVGGTYKQTLLLALANPYKLMQGEADRVNDYLAAHSNVAKLYPWQQTQGTLAFFLINLESDSPPKSMEQEGEPNPRSHILLSTDALVSSLHEQIAKLESGRPPKQLSLPDYAKEAAYLNLMRRLLKDWTVVPKRKFKRTVNNSTMEICAGLRAICHFINRSGAEGEAADFAANQTAGTGSAVVAGNQFASSLWVVTNESAGGLGLKRLSETGGQIRVGEIVGLRLLGGQQWNIGVVRRVMGGDSENVELGVQMLAPAAAAITIKPVVSGPRDMFQAALLLPEIRPLQQPATLIAPPGTFRTKLEYLLYQNGAINNVRAMQLVEQTAGFDRFLFSVEQS
ncbi:MAG: hypothetical protein ACREUV_06740 [Burkholderiales bacterium]